MFKNTVLGSLTVLILAIVPSAFAGKVELTTYYPAPYGEYKELKASQALLQPTDTPNTCDSTREGAMYYDLSEHATKVCRGDGAGGFSWASMSLDLPPTEIGQANYGVYAVPTTTNTYTLTVASVSGSYATNQTTNLYIDLSNFPSGFYDIEWGYNIDITASAAGAAKNVTLQLNLSYGGDYYTKDSVVLQDDEPGDGIPTTAAEVRSTQLSISKRDGIKLRIRIKKNSSSDSTIKATVNSAYIKVTRM